MVSQKAKLKEKHERLHTALKRVSVDKPEARKSILADIQKVELEFSALQNAGTKKQKKPTSSLTLLLLSICLATLLGFSIYYFGGNIVY